MVCLVPKTVRRCPDESSDALSDAAGLLTGPAPAGPFLARAPMQPFYSVSSMSNVVKAHLGLILSYVIWAVNYPLYKVIMPHYISPYAMTMLVVGVAALLAFGSMLFVPIEPVRRQDILKLVAAAALMGIAKKLFLMVGIQHTSPIDASIIATLGPILVLVISVMFLVDRFTPMKVLGMALGLAGALVVILSGSGMQAPSDKLSGGGRDDASHRAWPVAAYRFLGHAGSCRVDRGLCCRRTYVRAELPPYLQPALREAHDQQHLFLFGARHRDGDFRGDAYGHAVVGPRAGLSGGIRRRAIPGSSPVLRAVAFLRVGERPSVRASGCVAGAIGRSSN